MTGPLLIIGMWGVRTPQAYICSRLPASLKGDRFRINSRKTEKSVSPHDENYLVICLYYFSTQKKEDPRSYSLISS